MLFYLLFLFVIIFLSFILSNKFNFINDLDNKSKVCINNFYVQNLFCLNDFNYIIKNKRKSKKYYTNIWLCTIAKEENNYINNWVKYYIDLGFSHIVIYDNNEKSLPYVGNFIDKNYINKVKIINVQGQKYIQLKINNECYNKYKNKFDWMAFFDVDEFLVLDKEKYQNVNEFLSDDIFNDAEAVKVNWKIYGDDDKVTDDLSIPVYKRIKKSIGNSGVSKPIVRGGLKNIQIKNQNARKMTKKGLQLVYYKFSNGTVMTNYKGYINNKIYLAHYTTKTLSEFIEHKLFRGDAIKNRTYNLDIYFGSNKITQEKINYIKKWNINHPDKIVYFRNQTRQKLIIN